MSIEIPKLNKQHMGVYCIIINNYIYIGESFDLSRRFQEHYETLKNNTHHNLLLQKQYNNTNGNNVQFKIICNISYNFMRFVYSKRLNLDDNNNIINLLKIILLCIEHKFINIYKQNSNYIICNSENTLLKIYHLLDTNNKIYLKQCYNIINNYFNSQEYNIKHKHTYIINIIKQFNNDLINNLSHIDILNIKDLHSNNIKDYYI